VGRTGGRTGRRIGGRQALRCTNGFVLWAALAEKECRVRFVLCRPLCTASILAALPTSFTRQNGPTFRRDRHSPNAAKFLLVACCSQEVSGRFVGDIGTISLLPLEKELVRDAIAHL